MSAHVEPIRALLLHLATSLVDRPEQVRVEAHSGHGGTTFEVHVADGDAGKVIGKHGRIAEALRLVAKAAALKHGAKVFVEIAS